jgi:translation initiation factor IF-2
VFGVKEFRVMRVQDLAKKYKMEKKQFLELLNAIGIRGKKTVSALSKDELAKFESYVAGKIKEKLSAQEQKEKRAAAKKAEEEKKKAEAEKKKVDEKKEKEKAAKKEKKTGKPAAEKKPGKKTATAKKEKDGKSPVKKRTTKETAESKEKKTAPAKKTKKEEKPPVKKQTKKAAVPAAAPAPAAKPEPAVEKPPAEKTPPAPQVQKPPAPPVKPAPPAPVKEEKKTVEKPEAKPAVKPEVKPVPPVRKKIVIEGTENIKEFSEKTRIPAVEIIKYFFSLGFMVNINQSPGKENLRKVCEIFKVAAEFEKAETVPEKKKTEVPAGSEGFVPRAPVVTIMGHVDHGKTTILDTIRKSRIAEKEHGQITQKIGAYKFDMGKKGALVFLDTPGHESFTAMRARGALVTDIVILVVAADEGIKPQTVEAINHAKSAGVPIIVAVNKVDKPNINPDKVKKQLSEYKLIPEEWGGDTVFVNVSGLTGAGIKELLEMLVLMGEMLELTANPQGEAEGIVIESFVDRSKGPIINALIRKGTLKTGDPFIAGNVRGRVRAIMDDWNRKIDSAGPSTPVEILGADGVAVPGEEIKILKSGKAARQLFEEREGRGQKESAGKKVTLQELSDKVKQGETKELNLIVKSDYAGTIDAIRDVVGKIPDSEVNISIIHAETGAISESDVLLASASNAVIVGFNVPLNQQVDEMAKAEGIEVRTYKIIYELADDVRKAVEGMLEPEEKEVLSGQASVKKVFNLSDKSTIAGCIVVDGKILRGSIGKVVRSGSIVFQGSITSLKRFKENAKEVKQNTECGIGIDNFTDFREGDIIQSYVKTKTVKRL